MAEVITDNILAGQPNDLSRRLGMVQAAIQYLGLLLTDEKVIENYPDNFPPFEELIAGISGMAINPMAVGDEV